MHLSRNFTTDFVFKCTFCILRQCIGNSRVHKASAHGFNVCITYILKYWNGIRQWWWIVYLIQCTVAVVPAFQWYRLINWKTETLRQNLGDSEKTPWIKYNIIKMLYMISRAFKKRTTESSNFPNIRVEMLKRILIYEDYGSIIC